MQTTDQQLFNIFLQYKSGEYKVYRLMKKMMETQY